MTPDELKRANIERFEKLLLDKPDTPRREAIERMLAVERTRPSSAYPPAASQPPRRDGAP